jgi:thiamine-monophosphate kinase
VTSDPRDRPDEFETIARLLRPLAAGAPEARDLIDDVAVVPPSPGHDLIITQDALVEGVHFLPEDPLDLVAKKLLRVNLSDLAAKAAEPYGYLMSTAWSPRCGWPEREAFARGLAEDQARYGIRLFGGDTVSTPGPLTLSLTALGHAPHGRALSRRGAEPGHLVFVTGSIGDGWLGLMALRGELTALEPARVEALASRYRLPEPRTALAKLLREHASASVDVSDGLVADLGHLAEASGVGLELDLERTPLSRAAKAWLEHRADPVPALTALATGGDDYEIAFTAASHHAEALRHGAEALGLPIAAVGKVTDGEGIEVRFQGVEVPIERTGWRHG